MRLALSRASARGMILAALLTAAAAGQSPVHIFVQAGSGGLAAPGAGDSAADVRKALQSKRDLQVVESPAEADVVLRIDSRNERKDAGDTHTYANTSKDGKNTTVTSSQDTKTVKVMKANLLAGEFQMPMEAEDTVSWRFAAGNMANQVERWSRENSSRLLEHRYAPASPRASSVGPPTPTAQYAPDLPPAGVPLAPEQSAGQNASLTPGMTEQDVLAALGAPDKRVSFGQKSMWTYRGMQVVFTAGRVSDVKF